MAHGNIDNINRRVGEQVAIVCDLGRDGVDLIEPGERGLTDVTHRREPRPHRVVNEGRPPLDCRSNLATHQTRSHYRDIDLLRAHFGLLSTMASASSTLAPRWRTAISAAVIPAGFGCWMMLRPYTIPRAPWSKTATVRSSSVRSSTRPPPRTKTGTSP